MKPTLLCIMDGVAIRNKPEGNAFYHAKTPNLNMLFEKYPKTLLEASGKEVGIPVGQMGNSEVGHMNIGAGRKIKQPLIIINEAINNNSFYNNETLVSAIKHSKTNKSRLHLLGLVSDGGVHSHMYHLFALLRMAKQNKIKKVYIHVITDGRDTERAVILKYLKTLEDKIKEIGVGIIATISGRYYIMDRDNKWDRTELGYNAVVKGNSPFYNNYKELIDDNYKKEIYDEFIKPGILDKKGLIKDNDSVIIFNFRSDRLRQIAMALTNRAEVSFETKKIDNLKLTTIFPISSDVESSYAYEIPEIINDLGEYLAKNGISQLRIAETEKFPHVTYFFDGVKEETFPKETKILVPSPNVATYDLTPKMSALEITKELLKVMKDYEFILLNFANGDMVGLTGNFEAAVKAVETVDEQIGIIFEEVEKLGGLLVVTADHGNCDNMTGKWLKTHTTNPVPFLVCKEGLKLKRGKLGDIAPTILKLMNLEIPKEMTGSVLIEGKENAES